MVAEETGFYGEEIESAQAEIGNDHEWTWKED